MPIIMNFGTITSDFYHLTILVRPLPMSVFHTRLLNLNVLLEKRSHFLFGPRATGKSTLIKTHLPDTKVYDLLDPEVYQRFARNPSVLSEETAAEEWVVIDEIQKMPALLDEVHRLIEKRKQRFLLTGSSARKLKRGAANLLAGRAFHAELFPLVSAEIKDFDLLSYLNSTGLPEFYHDDLSNEFLRAYVGTYLQEEIQAESLTRNLPGFSRFLEVCALNNGGEIVYANISQETGVRSRTLENYFSILSDTLIGFQVPGFTATQKRKAIARSKHYFFDVGVVNTLARRGQIAAQSELFGPAFEHFIALELRAYLSYARKPLSLTYWRSTAQHEVDFLIGNLLAIEVKGSKQIAEKHLKGLRALKEEQLIQNYAVVSLDANLRTTDDGITIYPWQFFLNQLWADKLF